MAERRRKLVAGLAALVALSLLVCPLGWGAAGVPARAAAQGTQFDIPTIIGTPITMPTPISTVGPGQYFEEDDQALPPTRGTHGDEDFGWAELAADARLELIWYTDDEGTHYLVISGSSELLLGTYDEQTGTRLDDGFEDYVRQREELEKEILDAAAEGIGSSTAGIIAAAFLTSCPETFGAGCVASIVIFAATGGGNAIRNIIRLVGMNVDRGEVENNLEDRFRQAQATGGL